MRPGSCVGGSFGSPGSFLREAAARAAADDLYLYGGGLTPELAELIERTYRGIYLLTYLKQEELEGSDRKNLFSRAVEDARIAADDTLGMHEVGSEEP